jgi:drug/metabolite transporter (DMT)-like permease
MADPRQEPSRWARAREAVVLALLLGVLACVFLRLLPNGHRPNGDTSPLVSSWPTAVVLGVVVGFLAGLWWFVHVEDGS